MKCPSKTPIRLKKIIKKKTNENADFYIYSIFFFFVNKIDLDSNSSFKQDKEKKDKAI